MLKSQRINFRVSGELNKWLDKKSEEMAIPKSNIVTFAVEQYRQNVESVAVMPDLKRMLEQMEIQDAKQ